MATPCLTGRERQSRTAEEFENQKCEAQAPGPAASMSPHPSVWLLLLRKGLRKEAAMALRGTQLGGCRHVCGRRRGSQERNGRESETAMRIQESSRDGAERAKRRATATLGLP